MNLLWRTGELVGRGFVGVSGERVEVVSRGEQASGNVWSGVDIVVDGERRRGTVVIGGSTELPQNVVLRIVESCVPPVLGPDDELVTQVTYSIDPGLVERYDALRAGAAKRGCAGRIASKDPLYRTELMTALLVRRLQRKTARVEEVFANSQRDWNQTFWVLLLEVMGGNRNREVYSELARRVRMITVSREKGTAGAVETLLVGGAGFLDDVDGGLFRHLAAKHSVVPLRTGDWDVARMYPVNHPKNRLRQVAALVGKHDFLLDRVLDCLNGEDVERLFSLPSPPVGVPLSRSAGRLGASKASLVGINLVAPLMFAYGRGTGRDELCERALDLLGSIGAEENSKLRGWYDGGCRAASAFESQALLELGNEFCAHGLCAECRLGRGEIVQVNKKLPIFAV